MSTTVTRPVLTNGTQHDDVHELGRLLAAAGYENSVSEGRNPFGLVDETILAAAAAYRVAHGVDPESTIPGVPPEQARAWIGPELWAALVPEQTEPESDEDRAARLQREAEAREQRAWELRAELERIEQQQS